MKPWRKKKKGAMGVLKGNLSKVYIKESAVKVLHERCLERGFWKGVIWNGFMNKSFGELLGLGE